MKSLLDDMQKVTTSRRDEFVKVSDKFSLGSPTSIGGGPSKGHTPEKQGAPYKHNK